MKHECAFWIGDCVRLKHDATKERRMVVQVSFGGTGTRYNLMCGTADTWHYEMEVESVDDTAQTVVQGFKAAT